MDPRSALLHDSIESPSDQNGRRNAANRSIGAVLVDAGHMTPEAAEGVLRYQRQHSLPFGEAAIRMGLVTQTDVDLAIARQFDYQYVASGKSLISSSVVAAYDPFDPRVEALRAIRTQLLLRTGNATHHLRIAVVSPQSGDGRSNLVANLAVVFSQLGERTLLIDADLRKPQQHELFGLENRSGLSSVLSGRSDLSAVQRVPDLLDLSVLTSGPKPPNPQELLGRKSFGDLLDQLSLKYEMILIDTPSSDVHADAVTVANRAGSVLVVARQNFSSINKLRDLAQWMSQARVSIVGSVLNAY